MRSVGLEKASIGVTIAKNIYSLDGVQLLKQGTKLSEEYREKLIKNGVTSIFIEIGRAHV